MITLLRRLVNRLRRKRDDYHVVIDDSGAARAVNFHKYLLSAEGQERLRRMSLFAERHGNNKGHS